MQKTVTVVIFIKGTRFHEVVCTTTLFRATFRLGFFPAQVEANLELVSNHFFLTSNTSLIGLSDNQATLELDNTPEEDVGSSNRSLRKTS